MTKNRITSLVAIIFGISIGIATFQLDTSIVRNDIGPKVFPCISSALLVLCGIGLFFQKPKDEPAFFTKAQFKRLCIIVLVLIAYCASMFCFGFLVPSAIFLFITSTMFSTNKVSLWKRVLFSVVLTVSIYFLFTEVLVMKLPVGKFV